MNDTVQTPQQVIPPEQVIITMRERVQRGEQLTREEVRDALLALRANRRAAAEAAGKKAAAVKQPTRSPTELLAALKSTPVASNSGS